MPSRNTGYAILFAVLALTAPLALAEGAISNPPLQQTLDNGYRALNQNDLDAAESAFNDAARISPGDPAPILGLAEVAKLRNDRRGVEKWLKRAIVAAPNDAGVRVAWGRYLNATGKFKDSEAAFQKALEFDAKSFAAHVDLGELYMSGLRDPAKAEQQFRAAVQLRPEHAGAHNGLGTALAELKRTPEAALEFEAAAKLDPDNPLPFYSLGKAYLANGDANKALAAYDRALRISPRFTPALLDRGDVHAALNQPEQALADYHQAVKVAPQQANAHFRLGMFLHARHDLDEAAAAYRAAIEADPRYAPAYNNLAALTVARKGNLDDALGWAKKAVELQPRIAEFADTLGQVYQARGDRNLAIVNFRRASNAKPPRAEHAYHLGLALAEKGDNKEAVAALTQALALNANFDGAQNARDLLKKLGS